MFTYGVDQTSTYCGTCFLPPAASHAPAPAADWVQFSSDTGVVPLSARHRTIYTSDYYKKPFSNKTGVDLSNPSISQICQLSHMAEVSNVESFSGHGSKYVRSSGTRAILISFNMENHTALLQMPSGASKSFSIYSLALIGPSALKVRRQFRNTKSGYWRSIGHKPKVRGVARNPVDHPHGGRTKSIRYPRTPWGKTTKYK